jgi:hypothetical protein
VTPLSLFGLCAVTAMLVCYALEARSPWCILAFAVACWLGSAYGFMQGAWPFGLVEAVWGLVAVARWRRARAQIESTPTGRVRADGPC